MVRSPLIRSISSEIAALPTRSPCWVTVDSAAEVAWERHGDLVAISVTVPPGAGAVLRWPGDDDRPLPPGAHTLEVQVPRPADRIGARA